MDKIIMQVTGNSIKVMQRPAVITSGTVGLPIEFSFDSQWDGLHKLAVFRAGQKSVTVDIMLVANLVVPWEVLEEPNLLLSIGAYGTNWDDRIVIPTLWGDVGMIRTGTDPEADPAVDPTAPVWQEVLARVDALESEGGAAGKDGESAYAIAVRNGFEGTEVQWLESLKGKDGQDGADGTDGNPGKDGVSVTHSWDGTVLTATSASGTSSADLKGEKGDQGNPGTGFYIGRVEVDPEEKYQVVDYSTPDNMPLQSGDLVYDAVADALFRVLSAASLNEIYAEPTGISLKGTDGYTPVRGTDYWTPADIAEIKGYVDEAILGGAW